MKHRRIAISILLLIGLSACTQNAPLTKTDDKVKLSIASMTPFPVYTVDALEKKFPEISFDFITVNPDKMKTLIETKTVPDIIMDVDRVTIPQNLLSEVEYDMTPLFKQGNLDLNTFEPGLITHVKSYGTNGQLYALPYSRYLYALFYNKSVFDKASISYPKDGISWKEVTELANHFSNLDHYHGLEPLATDLGFVGLMDQRALSFLDPSTGSSVIQSDNWKKLFASLRTIYSISGNGPENLGRSKAFTEQGAVAMAIGSGLDLIVQGAQSGQNIDIVSFPTLDENPSVGPGTRTLNLMITAPNKNKKKSFDVISYLVSKEIQLQNSRNGIAPVLADKEIMKAFGKDIQVVNGKNVQAFFQNKLPNIDAISPYEGAAYLTAVHFIKQAIDSSQDLDIVMGKMQMSIDEAIVALKNQQLNDKAK